MGDRHIYFTEECEVKIRELERGELSTICQKAVMEYFGLKKRSSKELKSEIDNLNYEMEMLEKKKQLRTKQLKLIEKEESEKEKTDKEINIEIINKEKEARGRIRTALTPWLNRDLTEKEIDDYLSKKDKFRNIFNYGSEVLGANIK